MRDEAVSDLKSELESVRGQYREAMDRLGEREDTISHCHMDIHSLKATLKDTTAQASVVDG